ncbi:FtsK/SpoIIIE domain-containing protein [Halorubellus litoreus]|uniref:FtsK/SpoIIIE domain-containing protein n=1 Tax=Halorubellus litoreus TaxID=755308 RepID=A0ABD5VQ04_9EURY
MSDLFEQALAAHVRAYLETNPPRGGQILLGEFHSGALADSFAAGLVEELAEGRSRSQTPGGDKLPVFETADGVPVSIVRVVPDVSDGAAASAYEVTQGFATTMRNQIAASVEGDSPKAMIMVLETDASLDTLEASEALFGDDAPINLDSFRESVLDPGTCKHRQGRALLDGLLDSFEGDSAYSDDISVLETLCELRDAIDSKDAERVQELIGDLPQYLREDQLGDDWFEKGQDEQSLYESVSKALSDNKDHAENLRRAHQAGTNTESRLSSTYDETFVNKVLESPDWSELKHSDARQAQNTGGGPIQFRELSINAAEHRIYEPLDSDRTERSILAVSDDGELSLTVEFANDLEETPKAFWGPDGDDVGRLSKRENRATATVEGLPEDRPWFGTLRFWVGKKTKRGKPTHVFNLAVVPEWFFAATRGISLDVDVDGEALVSNGDGEIELQPLEDLRFESERRVVDLREEQTIQFDRPITIDPNPPDVVERVACQLAPLDGVPIEIAFLTEVSTAESEEVVFPLMLAAIVEPDRWAATDLQLPEVMDIDTDRGEIYTAGDDGIRLEDEALELLQIEEQIVDDGSIRPREVEGEDPDFGSLSGDESQLDAALREAYGELFEHFAERNRTPSTDPWDEPTQQRARAVVRAYNDAVDDISSQKAFTKYEPLRDVCTIRSTTTEKLWLTPFHPVLLAYALRIAEWRDDELVPRNVTGGFRREQFISKFNANGLHPYRTTERSTGSLLRGMPYAETPLWTVYSPVESPGSVTPRYMERVVRDKLYTFVQAFPILFQLHSGRQIQLNLVNMGDLRPVVKGLYEFYKKIEKADVDPPRVLLRIYGSDAEGEALERFFTESAESRLRQNLEKKNDELVDRLRSHVTYVQAGEYSSDTQTEAHLTFFRGLLEENPGVIDVGELPSGMLNDGLFPRESIDVEVTQGETVYTVGFSCDGGERDLIHEVARRTNALEAGKWSNAYHAGQTVKKNIESTQGADLAELWDDSLWVVHVQPNVGIDFYVRSDTELEDLDDRVMIHYSDQYDSSSPDYDVITSTSKRTPYLTALQRALSEANLDHLMDPETVLSILVSIDGEMALDLQQSEGTEVIETIGFVGGLALSQRLLERSAPDHLWIPLSLNELTRHDRSYRGGSDGLLQYDSTGKASDDLCFVGVPRDESDDELKLWVVETKGGTSQISTGRDQVVGAVENLKAIFDPGENYADEDILHGEFGKVVLDVARRMQSYDVFDDDASSWVEQRWRSLQEGDFEVSFVEDRNGSLGEVIRVRENTVQSEVGFEDRVRSIETSIDALRLLRTDDIEDVLPDLNLDQLSFEIDAGSAQSPSDDSDAPDGEDTSRDTAEPLAATPNASTGGDGDDSRPSGSDSDETGPDSEPKADSLTDAQTPDDNASDASAVSARAAETTESDPQPADAKTGESNPEEPEPSAEPVTETSSGDDARSEEQADDSPGASADDPPDESEDPADGEPSSADDLSPDSGEGQSRLESVVERLDESPEPETEFDTGTLASNIRDGFEALGVDVHPPNPSSISVGPRKIGVDVLPKEGQKVEGILSSLDSLSVHIQAQGNIVGKPIPSKGAVRLEIPHDNPQDIYLREGLEALAPELEEPLTIPLGVDTEREHHALSLPDERHALIAGATGSGKSNFLSAVLCSLVATNDPSEVEISLLDPKGVDFGRFADLPHVETYEDTSNDCATRLLDLVENRIPERKQLLKEVGATSVAELNEHAADLGHDPVPYHVVVIDEYADLKMSVDDADAFEDAVTRLAQVGRALGFVILLATQRPSADIVSGKIKANFPCRISFRLPSNTDSRVILDKPGAENLQGAGDMITSTQAGDEYHLQGYRLTLHDATQVKDWVNERDREFENGH